GAMSPSILRRSPSTSAEPASTWLRGCADGSAASSGLSMVEPARTLARDSLTGTTSRAVPHRLHTAAKRLGGRLAILLDAYAAGAERAGTTAAFLRELASTAGPGGADGAALDLCPPGGHEPVDRVAAGLALDALDLDL